MDTYTSDPYYQRISNLAKQFLSLLDPFSWNENDNGNENISYPSQLFTLNPHQFRQQCMVNLESYQAGKNNFTTFGDLLNTMGVDMDHYDNDNNGQSYQSYSCLLCATGKRAFYQATFDVVTQRNDYNPFAYSYFIQQLFSNATNIVCDAQEACYESTFELFEESGIDIYCRGQNSCDYASFKNAQSLYCFGADACSYANVTNVVCTVPCVFVFFVLRYLFSNLCTRLNPFLHYVSVA